MSIWVDENTKVVVQGLTGSQGRYYGLLNRSQGTQVVAGTNPRKAGENVEGIPIFATVRDAVQGAGANAAFVIVPAQFAADAVLEAAEGGVSLVVCVTEHIPMHDEARVYNLLKRDYPHVRLIGPNCSGILSPGKCNIGFTPAQVSMPGSVGIVSRSGTLAYQSVFELTEKGIGQSTCVGIGGDPVPGTSFIDCLEAFFNDDATEGVILIGEIGGTAEEEAAEFISTHPKKKPVVSYIAGVTAPPGKKMGHAGAIVSRGKGTAQGKMAALEAAGALIAQNPTELGSLMAQALGRA
ncbi:MAG: succinate--CoA ligase subunit alpha [bacterium]|nr:succinate--CoA ligase subunit alpha [bacterium]